MSMAIAMALCSCSSSTLPESSSRRQYLRSLRRRAVCRAVSSSISAQYAGDFRTPEDVTSKILRENPSRIERKCVAGDKIYTMKTWRQEQTPLWVKFLHALQLLKQKQKQETSEGADGQTSAAGVKPVYLRDLLREYKGELYVPEEVFVGQVSEGQKFSKEFDELPDMIYEDFVKLMKSNQVTQLKSKGTQFIVELTSLPALKAPEKWSLQLDEAQAQYVLSQFRGYHVEIEPRFAPVVVQPPPTPNPVAAAISNRLMLEFSALVGILSTAVFVTGKVVYAAAASVLRRVFSPAIKLALFAKKEGALGVINYALTYALQKFGEYYPKVDLARSLGLMGSVIFVLVVMAALTKFTLTRRSRNQAKWDIWQAIEFGQSKPQARVKGSTGVKFRDVAGIDDVVKELQELVAYLKDPEQFSKMGTKPPHGVLLEGPPGCGKTLLAKAVAGEAGVPFYQMAGSEFVEILVGVGAARVRDLFLRAKVNRPAVVFIDEIDALGAARSYDVKPLHENDKAAGKIIAGLQERETTLNQLLIELDGFDTGTGVIFLGATNRADLLDPALLRPGRFDRRILVGSPRADARYKILKVHSSKVRLDTSVDLWPYAKALNGWSGAQLAQLMQESALVAVRRGHKAISRHDLDTALDRLSVGPEIHGVGRRQSVHRRMSSVEIGMALVAHLLRSTETAEVERCDRISILPRGETYSRSMYEMLEDDAYLYARCPTLVHRLKVLLGARIGEELLYGRETSTLSASYLADAAWLARKIYAIWNLDGSISIHGEKAPWRRSRFGPPVSFEHELYEDYDLVGETIDPRKDDEVAQRTKTLMEKAYGETFSLLKPYKAALTKAVHVIMEKEEITGDELDQILARYPAGYQVKLVNAEEHPGILISDTSESPNILLQPAGLKAGGYQSSLVDTDLN